MLESTGHRSAIQEEASNREESSARLRATDWWMEGELRRLNAELTRTQAELETLRSTTAQVLTAILAALPSQEAPLAEVPSEIQELAELSEPAEGPSEDPVTGEVEAIDVTNRESLAYLDRRFRWVRSRQKDA